MNFSSMEYFTVLAQERNFTRAAERLHITQQSLSSHIAGMEKELGSLLLVRRVPLELTYAGEVLLRYAAGFLKFHNDMQREFCDISQKQKGILRVGAASTRGQMILPETIARFQKSYPNITVILTEVSNDELHQKLLKSDIDLAIAEFPENLPGIDDPVVAATSHNVGMLLRLSLCGVGACICPQIIVRNLLTHRQMDSLWMFRLGEGAASRIRFGCQMQTYQWSVIGKFIACASAAVC